ncbi:hypothetical protein AB0L28_33340 [Streptomyces sp. NPDC052503]|uniref:hypothetical protein n=1 Tax=Streptomyces sp. NPDC052503 TaxID=3156683 RepID=UPI0013687828|nr:hypothetical protein [Streptomyces sp. SID7834]MYT59859.1 hypothetical protein [Streptomyces sp. SID7834]
MTPLAEQQIKRLRRVDHNAYEAFLQELRSQGCKALKYRLTGDVVEHLCVKHLRNSMRVVTAFPARNQAVVLLVGPHRDDDPATDVYALLYKLARVEQPSKERRTKPPCCSKDDGLPPNISTELFDSLVDQARALRSHSQGRSR